MSELAKLKDRLSETFDPVEANAAPVKAPTVEATAGQQTSRFYIRLLRAMTLFTAGCGFAFASAVYLGGNVALYMAALSVTICVSCGFYMMVRSSMLRQASMRDARIVDARHRQNAALMAEIHEAMGDLVVTRDMDRRILQTNAAFCEMTGCTDPVGKTCEEIGIAFRPGGKAHCYDVEIATPYGQRIFTWHDVVANDPASSRLVISSLARDVTDERAALRTREDARLRAENANAAKGRLLATVSHEIRLPLSGILGMNHLLSQTKLTKEQHNYLDGMRQSGQSLVQLVEDLLDFSTMEAGRFRLNPRAENLRQLIESVVEMLSHRAHEKGIEIASIVSADVPDYLDFDPARLRQVLFNLIGNAVKFTAKGGVLVRASMVDDALSIAVQDTGPGIGKAEQARIFGEFEQAGSTSHKSAGTGLGLAISARIIREFGGGLTVASKKGEGSVFTATFKPASAPASNGPSSRVSALRNSNVLLLAPAGVAATATGDAIRALGGVCTLVSTPRQLKAAKLRTPNAVADVTDIIIDHRVASQFKDALKDWPTASGRTVRQILLVNPEERASQPQDEFDAWLIRPLREKSLTDVLCGRLRGLERRDAINDNQHPGFGFSIALDDTSGELDVLVAEDDPVNARILRAVLEKSGCHVRMVGDFDALTKALSVDAGPLPDLVISDLHMPHGDGLEVLPRLCVSLKGHKTVPIMVLSGDTTPDTQSALLAGGISTVLAKPVEPKRLIEEVLRLFPQKRTGVF
ncbi:putative two-component hybrid sensor and regulator [Agrobacterium rubi TR3 = NBRC 13261]|uniref:histidine kinase n=1 Tax=Agrobacterium rubi TR3 = NBRC 13261 TaxID=1368415 RepID=A0A081CV74_9HYPH|nr:PAS domain-containing sensor histidine kinase [Agrobacterium rubi]MBP1879427.1 signal transduction histidine kinase/ActR/RegA family two-component response regulator [Agrobacterium rubi]MCL6653367.1 hybrid sensor histidine kinase/response regulator [Agrobacterium rubi]GAK70570.1 putative two-component hybrid sensor and regulator [Agrobacterium rubi TR3 = NBRC 13261]